MNSTSNKGHFITLAAAAPLRDTRNTAQRFIAWSWIKASNNLQRNSTKGARRDVTRARNHIWRNRAIHTTSSQKQVVQGAIHKWRPQYLRNFWHPPVSTKYAQPPFPWPGIALLCWHHLFMTLSSGWFYSQAFTSPIAFLVVLPYKRMCSSQLATWQMPLF